MHLKEIQILQQTIDNQMVVNRETRQKIINDANKMIEDERDRIKKIHHEEMQRVK
jgi:hypothetical protein